MLINASAHLIPLADKSVHAVVMSPPFFRLRRYLGNQEIDWPAGIYSPCTGAPACIEVPEMRSALGNEDTIESYIWHMLLVLRESRRVLRDDGIAWVNIGDSFSNSRKEGGSSGNKSAHSAKGGYIRTKVAHGLPQGNVMGIPQRLMLAAQADTENKILPGGEIKTAWLGGLIDGDGSIGIRCNTRNREKGWNDQFSPYLTLGLTDREALEEVQRVTGFGTIIVKAEAGSSDDRGIISRRTYYAYRLDGDKAIHVIKYCYPYLIIKKKQALIAYNLWLLLGINRVGRYDGKVPDEIMEKRKWCYEAIKRLNQRQPVDIPNWIVDVPKVFPKPLWIVRNDCVWSKVACLPESVSGWKFTGEELQSGSWRHTRAHEYVFMLTKRMSYWADGEAVKEPAIHAGDGRKARARNGQMCALTEDDIRAGGTSYDLAYRNPRSVLTPHPSPYPDAHFAVFPPDLIRPLVLSSVPHCCCQVCGQGWAPIVKRSVESSHVTGYRPTCSCTQKSAERLPGIVLDPFAGSGTTGAVARECGVRFIGLDICFEYLDEQAMWRAERKISIKKLAAMSMFQNV